MQQNVWQWRLLGDYVAVRVRFRYPARQQDRGIRRRLPHSVPNACLLYTSDEVGELPMPTQARLLRVLETGEFIKVGSSKLKKRMYVLLLLPM